MRLSKTQVSIIASEIVEPIREAFKKKEAEIEKERMDKWLSTKDGKLYAQLPKWMKEDISEYRIRLQKAFPKKKPNPIKVPAYLDVENKVQMLMLETKNLDDLRKRLKAYFK